MDVLTTPSQPPSVIPPYAPQPEPPDILLLQCQAAFKAALADLMDAYKRLPVRSRYQAHEIIPGIDAGLMERVYADWRTARMNGKVI